MVKTGEGFYTSLGFQPLPATFWQRSQFTKPRDREVVPCLGLGSRQRRRSAREDASRWMPLTS
jgi:hypothetical protein